MVLLNHWSTTESNMPYTLPCHILFHALAKFQSLWKHTVCFILLSEASFFLFRMQSTNVGSSKLYQSQISINSFILFSYRVFFVCEFLLITWHLWTADNKRKTMAIQHKSQAVIERTWYTGRWCQQTSWIWTLSWHLFSSVQFSSVQSLSCVWLFVTPWIAA